MINISNKARNCLKKFISWGGFSGSVAYIIDGDLEKAVLTALIIGIVVILDENYSV